MVDADEDSFAGRMQQLRGQKSVRAFASELGMPVATIRGYLEGAMPGLKHLLMIAQHHEVTLDWLATGLGPKGMERALYDQGRIVGTELGDEFTLLKRLDIEPSAGHGALVEAELEITPIAFRSEWLRNRGINPTAAHVLTTRGHSMEPTIRDGDILLVDTSIDSVRDNAIYIVVFGGNTLVKRVQMRRDGSVLIKSDNKDIFDDEEVPEAEVPDIRIVGRVMWYGRSI